MIRRRRNGEAVGQEGGQRPGKAWCDGGSQAGLGAVAPKESSWEPLLPCWRRGTGVVFVFFTSTGTDRLSQAQILLLLFLCTLNGNGYGRTGILHFLNFFSLDLDSLSFLFPVLGFLLYPVHEFQ